MPKSIQMLKLGLIAAGTLTLAACESSGGYRLSSVGSVPDNSAASAGDGSSGSTNVASNSGGADGTTSAGAGTLGSNGVLVTAGNSVIGVAGAQSQLAGGSGGTLAPVDGRITRVLTQTGQTMIDLGNGRSAILDRAGGSVGDIVRIDPGSGSVIGAPAGSSLLGAGAIGANGLNLAGLGTGSNDLNVTASSNGSTSNVAANAGQSLVTTTTQPLTATLNGNAASPSTGANTGLTGTVNGTMTGVTGTVTAPRTTR